MSLRVVALVAALLVSSFHCDALNRYYPVNGPPLLPRKFIPLPLGSIRPSGWLEDQLRLQANGLTGHLDEFWPYLTQSAWKGGDGESWEIGPYYLDGLVPLAYLLDDPRLIEKTKPFIEWILASGQPDGWFGPVKNKDRWPLAVALKVLAQYYEATRDERALFLMKHYAHYLKTHPPDWPDKEWRGVRAMENVVSLFWLYRQTGDPDLIEIAQSIDENSFDWTGFFLNFPYTTEVLRKGFKRSHSNHVVNLAMAIKYPALCYQYTHDARYKKAVYDGIAALHKYHGQVAGRFSGDEHLSGRRPSQGTELCGVVEYMFSMEHLISVFGDPKFADHLEILAYNANPGACTPDYWAHQYDQQANQVVCSVARRHWDNGPFSNLYGLEPNYRCCTANMHQGWPKFVASLWMATHDQGLVAVAYGPCAVTARVADGLDLTIQEKTDYPFRGSIHFSISLSGSATFPLYFRIPGWADDAVLKVGHETIETTPETFVAVNRTWKSGDTVNLHIPMRLRVETRYNNSVAILRGPLYFSLKIGEYFKEHARHHPTLPVVDWEIYPTTRWNYGLIVDRESPESAVSVTQHRIGSVPFAQDKAPVILNVKGRAIPEWVIVDNSAGAPPPSPVTSDQPATRLQLIPYGSAQLRITEFPVIANP